MATSFDKFSQIELHLSLIDPPCVKLVAEVAIKQDSFSSFLKCRQPEERKDGLVKLAILYDRVVLWHLSIGQVLCIGDGDALNTAESKSLWHHQGYESQSEHQAKASATVGREVALPIVKVRQLVLAKGNRIH